MNTIVRVPAIPESLYRSVQSQVGWFQKKTNLLEWDIKPGAWVEKGNVIAHYNVKESFNRLSGSAYEAKILAPFAGEILIIQNKEYTQWEKSDGSTKSGGDFNSDDILFVIKPSDDLEDSYPGFIEEYAVWDTYKILRAFTEVAKIPNAGSIMLGIKANVEKITT